MTARTGALLWFGIAGAPLAWALQLVVGYALEDAACPPGGIGEGSVGPAAVAVSAAGAALALLAIGVSLRTYRSSSADLVRFLAGAGVVAGLVFLGAIVASGLMLVSLDPCNPA